MTDPNINDVNRRRFLTEGIRATGAFGIIGFGLSVAVRKGQADDLVWQIDPDRCMGCNHCATHCVLDESAVKAVQCYPMCAMCDVCTGYFDNDEDAQKNTSAENQLCPTGAVQRLLVVIESEIPRFEYHIDESTCIGCGKCVVGCAMMNGSLYLQVRHDRCLNCNRCTIAADCPTQAFRRVPASSPYLLKAKARQILGEGGDV